LIILNNMNKLEEEKLKNLVPPEEYKGLSSYAYTIKHCPYYSGYKPKNLTHEVCKFCGSIHYYH